MPRLLLSTTVLAFLSACNCGGAAGEGEPCGPSRGCADGLTCHEGICIDPLGGDSGVASEDGGNGADAQDTPSDGSIQNDGGSGSDGGTGLDGGGTVDGGSVIAHTACDPHTWRKAVPAFGNSAMAYGPKAYVFAADGTHWTIIENETGTLGSIPLPAGIPSMMNVNAEIAPNRRPFVTFQANSQTYGAFFDGQAFFGVTALGQATEAHADAHGRIFALNSNGLTEYGAASPIVRGALPHPSSADGRGWTVGADGTVYNLYQTGNSSKTELHLVNLPHGSLTWGGDLVVLTNAGQGFSGALFAGAPDGSLHLYSMGYLRSRDGVTWTTPEQPSGLTAKANMVDPASPSSFGFDPSDVGGSPRLLSAQDYDHVSVTLIYNGGSMSIPSFFFMRRCQPFVAPFNYWPTDRLAYSGLPPFAGVLAVNEEGFATFVTPDGARQDRPDPVPAAGSGVVTKPARGAVPADLPSCTAPSEVAGPLPTLAWQDYNYNWYLGTLMAVDGRAFAFYSGSAMWTSAAHGQGLTAFLPSPLLGDYFFVAQRSLSGKATIVYQAGSTTMAVTYDGTFGTAVATPCSNTNDCDVRAAGDGHLWVRTGGNFHEQTGSTFANRGGGPVTLSQWDVDAQGTVIVLGPGDATEAIAIWKLSPAAGGWSKTGALKRSDVAAVSATITGGFQFGGNAPGALAPDGSIHLFSDAHCVLSGTYQNKVQVYVRSRDGVTWDVQTLPSADSLTGGQVTWKNVAFWASDYEHVRYIAVSSAPPTFDNFGWSHPDRRFDLIARCRDASNQSTFARVGSVPNPGWTDPSDARFSEWGVAATLTRLGMTQIYW